MKNRKIDSVLARINNKSKELNIQNQQTLMLFNQEEFLRRISLSNYRGNLILKGGFLIFLMTNMQSRPTQDADYLMQNHDNSIEEVKLMIEKIISINTGNDFIKMRIEDIYSINEANKYEGIRCKLIGEIGNTKTPFFIDIGVGDEIYPKYKEQNFNPMLNDFEDYSVKTYSWYSLLSEKIDSMLDRGPLNSRARDYFDVYTLLKTKDINLNDLEKALELTFKTRNRSYDSDTIIKFKELDDNESLNMHWNNFMNELEIYNLEFKDIFRYIYSEVSHILFKVVENQR